MDPQKTITKDTLPDQEISNDLTLAPDSEIMVLPYDQTSDKTTIQNPQAEELSTSFSPPQNWGALSPKTTTTYPVQNIHIVDPQASTHPTSESDTSPSIFKIILISLALILVGVLIGILASKIFQPSTKITKTPLPEISLTITETTTDNSIQDYPGVDPQISIINNTPTATPSVVWKTYQNTKYGYSLKYPPEWKLQDLSSGVQIELFFQEDLKTPVGEILIEKINKKPSDISMYKTDIMIGNQNSKCKTDKGSKTWCYVETLDKRMFSVLIVKIQNAKTVEYNKTIDEILSGILFESSKIF